VTDLGEFLRYWKDREDYALLRDPLRPVTPLPPWPAEPADLPRAEILDEAKRLITKERNNHYGPPTQDFRRAADILNALGFLIQGQPIETHHIAMIQAAVKLSRLTWSPDKRDSWVDLAGYAACGYECYITDTGTDEDDEEDE
jgi:hypothetical protein